MRTKLVCLILSPGKRNLLHPHEALIQAFNDGELSPRYSRRITSHLEICHDCRLLATQLRGEFSRFQELEQAAFPAVSLPVAQGLVGVLESIQNCRNAQSSPPEMNLSPGAIRPEVEARVISELEVYLGTRTVAGLADRLGRGEERFITEAENLISAFLGRRVADEVRQRISQILSLDSGFPYGPWLARQPL
jgi:hypothetical protein